MKCVRSNGFSFLEILIGLFIFAVGALGVLKMHLANWQRVHAVELRSLALGELASMAAEITSQAKRERPDKVLNKTFSHWESRIAKNLPLGLTHIARTENGYTLEVSWVAEDAKFHRSCIIIDDPRRKCVRLQVST